MQNDEKRRLRREKRAVKRDGIRQMRRELKRRLDRDPESARPDDDYEFGPSVTSRVFNEPSKDRTRRRDEDFLDEMDAERTLANPDFPRLLSEADRPQERF